MGDNFDRLRLNHESNLIDDDVKTSKKLTQSECADWLIVDGSIL